MRALRPSGWLAPVLCACVALLLVSCALAVSFDEYGTSPAPSKGSAPLYAVGGVATELADAKVTLLLEGTKLAVGNGSFSFPPSLLNGASYAVTIQSDPVGRRCFLDNGTGTIAGADRHDVAVRCPSTDAMLASLSISAGPLGPLPLTPVFSSGSFAYAATAPIPHVLVAATSAPTTLTVNATPRNSNARVSLGGVALAPGKPSAPVVVVEGRNVLDISVDVPGVATAHYEVVVEGRIFDYLKASNTTADTAFGTSLALSGVTLAVAAPSLLGVNPPAVFIFTRAASSWLQQAILQPDFHAGHVALDGDTLIVSGTGPAVPGVAIYRRAGAGWTKETFPNPGLASDDYAVALSGETAAIAYYAAKLSVHVFDRAGSTWTETTVFERPAASGGLQALPALALAGNTLVIGHPLDASGVSGIDGDPDDTSAPNAGAVYVLGRDASIWTTRAYLKASRARADASFGAAVAVSADTVLVGAPGESSASTGIGGNQSDNSAPNAGAAYVFERSAGVWTQSAYLKGASSTPLMFGTSVATNGSVAAVGAPQDVLGSGAVHLFLRGPSSWTVGRRLVPPQGAAGGRLGAAVAMTTDVLVCGAPDDTSKATGLNGDYTDQSQSAAGAVYVY